MARFVLACVLAAAASLIAAAQKPIRSRSDTVEVYVTVKRSDGFLVRGLTREDFEVFEDGKRREIEVFSADRQPMAAAILIDRSRTMVLSPSLGNTLFLGSTGLVAAGQAFVAQVSPTDRASVGTLLWDCLGFTNDFSALWTTLGRLPADYTSPIWPAADRALTALGGEPGRPIVLLVSDGIDERARGPVRYGAFEKSRGCHPATLAADVSIDDVIRRAERESVMVYSVALESRASERSFGAANMARIAAATGGGFQRISGDDRLKAAFTSIADELRMQYLLGFTPSKFDGKRHKIDVRVKRGGVSVRAREAYVGREGRK
jgi:Ca-activated chloride channel family protein